MIKIIYYKQGYLNETIITGLDVQAALQCQKDLFAEGYVANVYGLPSIPTPEVRVKQGKKNEDPKCSLCGTFAANDEAHPILECTTNQFHQAKSDLAKSKLQIEFWKTASYDSNKIIGKLACAQKYNPERIAQAHRDGFNDGFYNNKYNNIYPKWTREYAVYSYGYDFGTDSR